jgi:hypothetical protein
MTEEERKEIAEIAKSAAHYVMHETLMNTATKMIQEHGRGSIQHEVVFEMLNALVQESMKGNVQLMTDLFDITRDKINLGELRSDKK